MKSKSKVQSPKSKVQATKNGIQGSRLGVRRPGFDVRSLVVRCPWSVVPFPFSRFSLPRWIGCWLFGVACWMFPTQAVAGRAHRGPSASLSQPGASLARDLDLYPLPQLERRGLFRAHLDVQDAGAGGAGRVLRFEVPLGYRIRSLFDRSYPALAGIPIRGDRHRPVNPGAPPAEFVHFDFNAHAVGVGDGQQGRADVGRLARVGVAVKHNAIKRRPDFGLGHRSFEPLDGRQGRLPPGGDDIEVPTPDY